MGEIWSLHRDGTAFIVEFWMSGSTPHWRVQGAGRLLGGETDSRAESVERAIETLREWALEPWR